MNGLERCPECFKLPDLTFDDRGFDKIKFIFTCTQPNHVYQAMGDTIEGAIANWNIYAKLYRHTTAA